MKPERLQIWGVLNLTPDSFVPDSRVAKDEFISKANRFLKAGADILDVGAESTRPFCEPVPADEELRRLQPLKEFSETPEGIKLMPKISVDTYKAKTAAHVLQWGAGIINDIKGGSDDLLREVALHNAGIVLMHSKGDPKDMQKNPYYEDVVTEVKDFLYERTERALKYNIAESRIIWDIGIGFGKTLEHNLILLRNIETFKKEKFPLMVGISRKSLIRGLLGIEDVEERKDATLILHTYLALHGVDILRVHDVTPAVQLRQILYELRKNNG